MEQDRYTVSCDPDVGLEVETARSGQLDGRVRAFVRFKRAASMCDGDRSLVIEERADASRRSWDVRSSKCGIVQHSGHQIALRSDSNRT